MTITNVSMYRRSSPYWRQEASGPLCACGKWPGQHRWGDNACPNPAWRCWNGKPQWLESTYRLEANQ